MYTVIQYVLMYTVIQYKYNYHAACEKSQHSTRGLVSSTQLAGAPTPFLISITSTTTASSDAQKVTRASVQALSFAEWAVSGKMPTYCPQNCNDITMYRIL